MRNALILPTIALLLPACAIFTTSRYSISADNVMGLKSLGKTIDVGAFTATPPLNNNTSTEIKCGAAPITTPDGESYADYIRKAFIDELKMAGDYSETSPITLTGNLDAIDFTTNIGKWKLALTVRSSNGKSISVTEYYPPTAHFYEEIQCNVDAQFFVPAVQDLLGKVSRSPDFEKLVTP